MPRYLKSKTSAKEVQQLLSNYLDDPGKDTGAFLRDALTPMVRTYPKHWMESEPIVPIAQALRNLKQLIADGGHAPSWIVTLSNNMDELGQLKHYPPPQLDRMMSVVLGGLIDNHVDSEMAKASGLYSSIEALLICPVASLREKSTILLNRWRKSQNLSPVDDKISTIVLYTPKELEQVYGPMKRDNPDFNGFFFGLLWVSNILKRGGIDDVLRSYAARLIIVLAAYVLPEWCPSRTDSKVLAQDIASLFTRIFESYPILNDGFWGDFVTCTSGDVRTHVDRWDALVQGGIISGETPDSYLEYYSGFINTTESKNIPKDEILDPAARARAGFERALNDVGLVPHKDRHECLEPPSLKQQSEFFKLNTSVTFRRLQSEIEDEADYAHSQMDHISLDQFTTWFGDSTKLCHYVLPRLKKEIRQVHSEWPRLLREIERNVRKAERGTEMYAAMCETLQNMEKNIAVYCSSAKESDREAAYHDMASLHRELESCEGRYMPSSCDLHRSQSKLMAMLCRPIEVLWDLSNTRVTEKQDQLDALHAQADQLIVQEKATKSNLAKVQSQLRTLEAEHKTTKKKLEAAERAAAAKAHIEIEKQKSKYYLDVEKGINNSSSALRTELDATRAELVAYRQTAADNEKLKAEMIKMKQEMTSLKATKTQKDLDCKAAEEATKAITEGYDQLKETKDLVETRNVELEADLEKALEEQDQLRCEIKKLQKMQKSPTVLQSSSTEVNTVHTHTSDEEKHEKELQHLDSTKIVWKRALAEAESKRDKTKERKDALYTRIADVEKQIKALKESKEPKANSKPSSATSPWGVPAPAAQSLATAPVRPSDPIIVPSAVRKALPKQEQFPASGSATTPSNALRDDAPAFSSMRIKASGGKTDKKPGNAQASSVKGATGQKKAKGGWQTQ